MNQDSPIIDKDYKVWVRCFTFNHSKYIKDALNGFVMQETKFPFICAIVDDCSTDGEQDVIKSFLDNEFKMDSAESFETDYANIIVASHKTNEKCTFIVYFLKYNHYRAKKAKGPYLDFLQDVCPYVATCEGDDYWIDKRKLQMQVDWMDTHDTYTMVCNRTKLYSEKKERYIGENYCYDRSQKVEVKDIINRTGLFISTCSVLYRTSVMDNIPDYWRKCKVGDYPLQIGCAMQGDVYYFNDMMSVYRVQNASSWSANQKLGNFDMDRVAVIKSQVEMFNGFGHDYPKYGKIFALKIADQINRFVPYQNTSKEEINIYLDCFREYINKYSFIGKIDLAIMCSMHRFVTGKVRTVYMWLFRSRYRKRTKMYDIFYKLKV